MERGSGALADDDLFEVSIMKNEKKKKIPRKLKTMKLMFLRRREKREERGERKNNTAPPLSLSLSKYIY